MKVAELIEQLKDMPQDADVYYSTGSSLDHRWGSQHEVARCDLEFKTFGLALPKEQQETRAIVVVEGW